MPRVTTQQLKQEIDVIKDNHLAHMAEDIHELEESVKENRKYFESRLDRLDNRIWWVLGITVTTLISVMIGSMV